MERLRLLEHKTLVGLGLSHAYRFEHTPPGFVRCANCGREDITPEEWARDGLCSGVRTEEATK